jgi:hypothetical protein
MRGEKVGNPREKVGGKKDTPGRGSAPQILRQGDFGSF